MTESFTLLYVLRLGKWRTKDCTSRARVALRMKKSRLPKKRVVEEELTTNDLKELAGGNTNVIKEKEVLVDFWGKPLSKKEIRAMQKKGKA
mmetsp:Transcript_109588/g.186257  ORF Transcript_109588/g.186257 Transcript_109588/m.186257 type:complete len:91 (-) Transcript_109588:2165-2437(-)